MEGAEEGATPIYTHLEQQGSIYGGPLVFFCFQFWPQGQGSMAGQWCVPLWAVCLLVSFAIFWLWF